MAEQLICNQQVVGSTPTVGFLDLKLSWLEQPAHNRSVLGSSPRRSTCSTRYGLVAQLVRAPPCHGGGRGFEPHPGRCYHFPDDNLLETAYNYIWGLSSAGRASALQAEGHRFEPCRPHQFCRLGSMAEQLICNQQVVGSTPTVGSILIM